MGTWPASGLGGIAVIGVNAKDTNVPAQNAVITHGSLIPWLQDTSGEHLWDDAGASKDDVYILDGQHNIVRAFSVLTPDQGGYPLDGAGLDTLRAWVRKTAGVSMLANGEPPARRGTATIAAPAASSSQISPRR